MGFLLLGYEQIIYWKTSKMLLIALFWRPPCHQSQFIHSNYFELLNIVFQIWVGSLEFRISLFFPVLLMEKWSYKWQLKLLPSSHKLEYNLVCEDTVNTVSPPYLPTTFICESFLDGVKCSYGTENHTDIR